MKKTIIILFTLATLAVAGCGEEKDAGKGTRDKGSAKAIINMPDKFPSVALKCRGTTGIYVTNNTETGSGSPTVVANDPECR